MAILKAPTFEAWRNFTILVCFMMIRTRLSPFQYTVLLLLLPTNVDLVDFVDLLDVTVNIVDANKKCPMKAAVMIRIFSFHKESNCKVSSLPYGARRWCLNDSSVVDMVSPYVLLVVVESRNAIEVSSAAVYGSMLID
jgi:hypothetical protein